MGRITSHPVGASDVATAAILGLSVAAWAYRQARAATSSRARWRRWTHSIEAHQRYRNLLGPR
jgi:hypothetical protein